MRTNRWALAAAGVLLQLALGAVYAWSVFSKALQKDESAFNLTKAEAAVPFSVTIGMLFRPVTREAPAPEAPVVPEAPRTT
jgi:predicted Kef-type K+ transport protein